MNMRVNGNAFNGHTGLDGEQFNGNKSESTTSKGPRPLSSGVLSNLSIFAKRRPDGARLGVTDLLTGRQRTLLDLSNHRINVRGPAVDAADEAALQEGIAASLKEARPQAAPSLRRPTGDSGSRPPVPPLPPEARRAGADGGRPPVPPRPTTPPRQNPEPQHNPLYGHWFPKQGFGGTPRAASDDSGPLPNPWDAKPQQARQQPQARPRPQGASAETPRPAAPQARPSPSASASPQASPGPQKAAEAAKPQAASDASAPLAATDPKEVLFEADKHDPKGRWGKLTKLSQTVRQESAPWDEYMKTFSLWHANVKPTSQAQIAAYVKSTTTLPKIDASRNRLEPIEGEINSIGIKRWALTWHPDKLGTDNGVMKTINGEAQTANEKREKTLKNLQYLRGLLNS